MAVSFRNILLPVDFSINTELAVKKALELAVPHDTIIHLLHVVDIGLTTGLYGMFANITDQYDAEGTIAKLEQWKTSIEETRPEIEVATHLIFSNAIQRRIIDMAKTTNTQLIIIGKHDNHNWFDFFSAVNPDAIATESGAPVLTVKPGSFHSSIKSIVFPVSGFVPTRKIELLAALAKKNRAMVHLVTLMKADNGTSALPPAFIDTYRILKSWAHCPIEHKVLQGHNLPKAALLYAQQIGADIILVNPHTETRISAFSGRHITGMIKANSRLQVLTAMPYGIINS